MEYIFSLDMPPLRYGTFNCECIIQTLIELRSVDTLLISEHSEPNQIHLCVEH